MVYTPHTRVTLSGILYGGAEIFSTSFALAVAGGGTTVAPSMAAKLAIVAAAEAWFERSGTLISPQATMTQVRFETITALGTVAPGSTNIGSFATGAAAQDVRFPTQCALVLSMRPEVSTRRSRGRMYVPLPSVNLGPDGRLTDTDQVAFITSSKTFFDAIPAAFPALEPDQFLAVASSFGTTYLVDQVGAGRVVDTMRSRRNQLNDAKNYQALA